VGNKPFGVAITPDGTRAYVTNSNDNTVSVIDTTNMLVGSPITVGFTPQGVAITPDGKRAYVTNFSALANTVSVIDTNPASPTYNSVVATVAVGTEPFEVAITPDGTRAYVTNDGSNTVSVIDTNPASPTYNTVVATVGVGTGPVGVAITPDGTRAYVVNDSVFSNSVSVIDTNPASPTYNKVVATVGVGTNPIGVAITPDGKSAYVANSADNTVSVIDTNPGDTHFNTVVAMVGAGTGPQFVGIMPPPATFTFPTFNAHLQLEVNANKAKDALALESSFTLGMKTPPIDPPNQAVTFQVGPYSATIPAGKFTQYGSVFAFVGVINGVNVQALIAPTGSMRYAFDAAAEHPNLTGTTNPVPVTLTIGSDTGTKSVNATIFH
jgi:YVTN family beta-propeller protein